MRAVSLIHFCIIGSSCIRSILSDRESRHNQKHCASHYVRHPALRHMHMLYPCLWWRFCSSSAMRYETGEYRFARLANALEFHLTTKGLLRRLEHSRSVSATVRRVYCAGVFGVRAAACCRLLGASVLLNVTGNIFHGIEPNAIGGVRGILQELLQHPGVVRLVSRASYFMSGKNQP